ncbi:hypothetical protein [Dyella sp. 2RAB6]|uniref:hypothetical protein n=1 Tax=Dyella sp. 2RAB6 TaxID=3232992 RepID=UPI003F93F757
MPCIEDEEEEEEEEEELEWLAGKKLRRGGARRRTGDGDRPRGGEAASSTIGSKSSIDGPCEGPRWNEPPRLRDDDDDDNRRLPGRAPDGRGPGAPRDELVVPCSERMPRGGELSYSSMGSFTNGSIGVGAEGTGCRNKDDAGRPEAGGPIGELAVPEGVPRALPRRKELLDDERACLEPDDEDDRGGGESGKSSISSTSAGGVSDGFAIPRPRLTFLPSSAPGARPPVMSLLDLFQPLDMEPPPQGFDAIRPALSPCSA